MITLAAQHVLLLVDCHEDMFATLEDGELCAMDLAMTMGERLLQQRIRDTVTLKIGKRNGVGMLLFGTKPVGGGDDKAGEQSDGEDNDDEDNEGEEGDDHTSGNARSVHVFIPLDPPGIGQVKTIRACSKGDRNLQEEFAHVSTSTSDQTRIAPLQIALEEAVRIFRQAKCVRNKATKPNEPLDTRTIWILTNQDNPNYYSPATLQLLQNVARDVKESGIQILVWPLAHPTVSSSAFDMQCLYGDIVSRDLFEGKRLKTLEDMEEGLDSLQQFWKKIRRLYWGPLILPGQQHHHHQQQQSQNENDDNGDVVEKPHIMVDWFRFVQLAKKPAKVQIDQRTKRETVKLKQYMDQNHEIFATFKMGDASDRKKPKGGLNRIRQFASFGGENVAISDQDLARIRLLANGEKTTPGLQILGFKPRDAIPWYHMLNPAYLIYPNDDIVQGSREAFTELHAAMTRKNVLAVGEVLHRVIWSSQLVALYPLQHDEDETPGMMVVTLPFEDDIRSMDDDEAWQAWAQHNAGSVMPDRIKGDPDQVPSADLDQVAVTTMPSPELVQAAINLITRQRLSGMELGEDFENAALTEFFNYLEAVALEIPVPEDTNDEFDTRPDDRMILEAVGEQIEDFRNHLPQNIALRKESSAGSRKRVKESVPDDSGLDWKDLYVSGELGGLKVPQLKSYLRSVGAPLSGTKAVLLARVTEHIKQNLASTK